MDDQVITEDDGPVPVEPALRAMLRAAQGKSVLADGALADVRAMMAERARSRPGPEIADVRDHRIPGPGGTLTLRVYRPQGARGSVLAFHGGGWVAGDLESFDPFCRYLAQDSGVAIVSVDYRLAPEHPFPAAIEDAQAALAYVQRHPAALGLDEGPVVLFGESAGANLATVLALMARDAGSATGIARQILVYPLLDARMPFASMQTFGEGFLQTRRDVAFALQSYALDHGVAADDWRLSPLCAADVSGLPPVFLLSAECDVLRDDAAAWTQRLMSAGVPVIHVRYAGQVHTFAQLRPMLPAAVSAQRQLADEIRRSLQPL